MYIFMILEQRLGYKGRLCLVGAKQLYSCYIVKKNLNYDVAKIV